MHTIERLFQFCGVYLEGKPRLIATRNMITLRPCTTALAFLDTSQLLHLTMKRLHIPSHIVLATNDRCCEIWAWIVRDDPINVAICGNYLEESHEKGYFLYL